MLRRLLLQSQRSETIFSHGFVACCGAHRVTSVSLGMFFGFFSKERNVWFRDDRVQS